MDKRDIIKTAQEYANEVRKTLNPAAIILFGSFANGTPTDDSDIDIAIVFNGFTGDRWETSADLWQLTWKIDNRIEPILLDTQNDKSGFASDIFKTGHILYRAS